MTDNRGPLEGLAVLELTNMIAAPFAGSLLADMGASVVKVEHPQKGDDLRTWPPQRDNQSLWWKVTNRNKRLVTLDLSNQSAQRLVRSMVGRFDVLLENFRPGTLERWNLPYEQLAQINPRLVMVRVSGYGQTGPYSTRPGYATIAEAMSGIPSFTGFPDKPPTLSAFPLGDVVAGLWAVIATLMGLYERDHGKGFGQVADVSLYESLFRLVETQVIAYDQLNLVKGRNGNRMEEDSPRNAYGTADGAYVVISVGSNRVFERLAKAIGRPELAADDRFGSTAARVANAAVLDSMVAEWFSRLSANESLSRLRDEDVVAGPVYDIADIFRDEQYRARENIVSVPDPDFGAVKMVAPTPKFSRTPGAIRHPGGSLGQDNHWFYRQFLGLTQAEYDALEAEKAI